MLRISNLCKHFGETLLFDQVSFEISGADKVGIVGANGCGKSTLLKIIAGQLEADKGDATLIGNRTLGYLPQHFDDSVSTSLGLFLAPLWWQARSELQNQERATEGNFSVERYSEAYERFEAHGGYARDAQLAEILAALSLNYIDLERSFDSLSGGEKTRVALARLSLAEADLMLLDEPTNNLDKRAIEWLEYKLQTTKSACLIVSHDREFLDRVTNKIIEIDSTKAKVSIYSGNYTWYIEHKRREEERLLRLYKEQETKIKQLTANIQAVKSHALETETATQNDYLRGRSKKVAAKAKAYETRLSKLIEAEKIELPRFAQRPKLSLSGTMQYTSTLVEASDVEFRPADSEQTIISDINFSVVGSTRIIITGDNGSGKSTLLQLIADKLIPTRGRIAKKSTLKFGYLPQTCSLCTQENMSVIDYLKLLLATDTQSSQRSAPRRYISDGDLRKLLHRFQFARNDVFKQLHMLSRGERSKLILAGFMANDLDLIVLDEPTNHLDVESVECFEMALDAYQGAMIVVSHDRHFITRLKPDNFWSMASGRLSTHFKPIV